MGFNFVDTVYCDFCGGVKESSDESCSCDSKPQMFRDMSSGSVLQVEATTRYKWERLASEVDDWVKYAWLGPRDEVRPMVDTYFWPTIEDVPVRQVSAGVAVDGD